MVHTSPDPSHSFKILGRDPILWLAFISAALSIGTALRFDGLSADQVALIVAAINAVFGLIGAFLVRPIAPQAFTFAIAAFTALVASYGYEVSSEVIGALNVAVLAALALVTRGQSNPQETALTRA